MKQIRKQLAALLLAVALAAACAAPKRLPFAVGRALVVQGPGQVALREIAEGNAAIFKTICIIVT